MNKRKIMASGLVLSLTAGLLLTGCGNENSCESKISYEKFSKNMIDNIKKYDDNNRNYQYVKEINGIEYQVYLENDGILHADYISSSNAEGKFGKM